MCNCEKHSICCIYRLTRRWETTNAQSQKMSTCTCLSSSEGKDALYVSWHLCQMISQVSLTARLPMKGWTASLQRHPGQWELCAGLRRSFQKLEPKPDTDPGEHLSAYWRIVQRKSSRKQTRLDVHESKVSEHDRWKTGHRTAVWPHVTLTIDGY